MTNNKVMKTTKILFMAFLLIAIAIMTGCSANEDVLIQNLNNHHVVHVSLNLSKSIPSFSRIVDTNGITTFAMTDSFTVVYETEGITTQGVAIASVSDVSADGKGCNVEFDMINPLEKKEQTLLFLYPANCFPNAVEDPSHFFNQDGSLGYIGKYCNIAIGQANAIVNDDKISLSSVVDMYPICTLLKLKLYNNEGKEITKDIIKIYVQSVKNTGEIVRCITIDRSKIVSKDGVIWLSIDGGPENSSLKFIAEDSYGKQYSKVVDNISASYMGKILNIHLSLE